MKIHALGTHSDWVYNGGAWGRAGQQRIADLTFAAGIRRLYWRTHNGGQAMYPSQVATIQDGSIFRKGDFQGYGSLPKSHFAYAQYIDYSEWDQLADMAEIGSLVGLEVCHWYTVYEDNHGVLVGSEFEQEHPEFRCQTREGKEITGCLDFWFPEVRAYKLKIVDELLEKSTNRMLLDFVRRNGKPSADAAGNFRYGFNPEIVDAFRAETGLEALKIEAGTPDWETWLDFHSRSLTEFLHEVKKRAAAKGVPLDILMWDVDPRRWQALDLAGLVGDGTVDEVLTATQRYATSAADARRQVEAARTALGDATAPICPALFGYHKISPRAVDAFIQSASDLGCEAVVLHECNHIIESPIGDHLRAWTYGKPHCQRTVVATAAGLPGIAQEGFIKCYDASNEACNQDTAFTATYTDDALVVTVTCRERDPEGLLPVPGLGTDNYNANQLKARAFWNPYESIHLFLDPQLDHDDYCHFVLDPSGAMAMEKRLDEDWSAPWTGEVKIGATAWTATFTLPWDSLGVAPQSERKMGFQLVRMQNNPREISAWFCVAGRHVSPQDFGVLKLG